MNEILQLLLSEGFSISEFIPDGKIRRFSISKNDSKKSGYYVGYRNFNSKTGEEFYVVQYGTWHDRTSDKTYSTAKSAMSAADKKSLSEQIRKAQLQAEAIRDQEHEKTALEVQEKWNKLSETGTSEYLERKQISKCDSLNIRFDNFSGDAYVPVKDSSNRLWSLQRLSRDGSKTFHSGGRVRDGFSVIGNLGSGGRIYITEGFATAASIRLATGETCVCAFNASNLASVSAQIRKSYPDAEIVICGDDDRDGKKPDGTPYNAGRVAGEEAAKKSLGVVVFPRFDSIEGNPTDFNDLHCREGLDVVREQLESVKTKKLALYALGFKEKEYFFTSTQNRQIVSVTAFSERDFLDLMTLDYWESMFPGEKSSVDWTSAKSSLMRQCREKGIFNGRNVRGAGVWIDDGRIVVNMGDHLLVDGHSVSLGAIRSRYFYTLGKTLEPLHENALSIAECETLVNSCAGFKWTKPDSGILLAGALVCSRICGALPVRPHCWITGGAETGKTTLLESLVRKIMGESKLYVFGNTTEAGLRQDLKANALPVLFDEFETTDLRSSERVSALIELMRASWSESGAVIVKGGASGNSAHYQVRFSAIVSSIRTKLTNDADKGRFAVVELAPHGSDQEHWRKLSMLLSKIDEEYSERLFARTIRMLPTILKNFKIIKTALAKKASSRFGDQYGMLLAGYASLIFDGEIDAEDAEFLAEQVNLDEERENSKIADHDDALARLLSTRIHLETGKTAIIGDVIQTILKPHGPIDVNYYRKILAEIGIRVEFDFVSVVSSLTHAEQRRRIWENTKWADCWGVTLSRLSGASKGSQIWLSGKNWKCVKIPTVLVNEIKSE